MEEEDNIFPCAHYCAECHSQIIEDESPNAWRHADTDELSGMAIDLMHAVKVDE